MCHFTVVSEDSKSDGYVTVFDGTPIKEDNAEDSMSDEYDTVYNGTLKEDKSVSWDKRGELMKLSVLEVRTTGYGCIESMGVQYSCTHTSVPFKLEPACIFN